MNLTHCFDLKIHLRKKFVLEQFIVIRVVTASLLIMEKPSTTFIPERLNTWESPILQENASKTSAISNHLLKCNCAIDQIRVNFLAEPW